ncbi:hypothetical protein FO519_008585 [Halicephalobus sp. NKZ332]|nr:hypothetical protein FO519_008585 [Halicephalobus sp. NKZ332]
MDKIAIDFSPVLSKFTKEPTFVIVDRESIFFIIIIMWIMLAIVSILSIIVVMALLFELSRYSYTVSIQESEKTLVLSCAVQIGITFMFLFIPVMVLFYYLTFGYVYGGPTMMIFICVLSLHAIMEMLVTTYFVLPYRRFVKRVLKLSLSLTKPCFLMPSAGGFVLGPLGKIGNSTMSCYFILADCLFALFTVIGMTMSLVYRYTSIFPGRVKEIGTSKSMIAASLILQLVVTILICMIAGKFFSLDRDTMVRMAIEFSPVLSQFTNEPTFVLINREPIFLLIIMIWIVVISVSILFIILAVALIIELKNYKYTMNNFKFQKALILSCIVQVGITFVFLFIPVMILLYYLTFGYVYGGPTTMIGFCFFSLHAIMEMLTTTYFVLPYMEMNVKGLPLEYFYHEKVTNFNIVFTTLAAVITVSIAPFYLYIVLTQSKRLGTYRILLLNHSIWSICTEISWSLTKPCVLMPSASGFLLGPLGKIGDSKMASYFFLLNCLLTLFTIVGMTMSLVYRYTSIFPGTVKTIGTSKWTVFIFLTLQLIIAIIFIFITRKFFSFDHDTMARKAIEFNPVLSRFVDEPTFIFSDKTFIFPIALGMWITLAIFSILFILVAGALIFELAHNKYTMNNFELQKALILSCLFQIGVTFVFLFIPEMTLFYCLTFGYIYAGPITMISLCVLSLHAMMEMLVTMYLVLPYRNIFTTITGGITVLAAPFYLYIIATQSKELGTYRFLLLNHSIWSICAEISFTMSKPCILAPSVAGFILGPLGKIGNSKMGCYFVLINCLLMLFTIVGMTMTLSYRYTNIFPGIVKKIGTSRWMIIICLVHQFIIGVLIWLATETFFSLDRDNMIKKAIEFNPVLSRFTNEPTFVLADKESMFPIIVGMWSSMAITVILFLIVAVALIFESTHNKYTSSNLELQKALILSCVAQVMIAFVFLFIPPMIFFYSITFGDVYAGPMTLISFCVLSLHAVMEIEKVTNFNIIFTTITAAITVLIAPFYLYIIVTQSKSLGNYRFFLLNHSIWSICAEISFSLTKPCMLMPCAAGFILGPLGKIGGVNLTSYFFLSDCLLMLFTIAGMTMSLVYRYTNIFPGIVKKIGTSRWTIFMTGKLFGFDHDTMARKAIEFSPVLSRFVDEPTFMLSDKDFIFPIALGMWITLTIVSTSFIIVAVALVFELARNKYTVRNLALQRALILSCIIQIGITFVFLLIPVMVFFYCLTYGISYAGPITMISLCVLSLHAIMEMLATTYFVLPYRRFVLRKLFNVQEEKTNTSGRFAEMSSRDFPIEYFYNETVTNFNIVFTTVTAAITISIAPFYLYIVLTQSKSLGTYRILLLNHSIWSICTEISWSLTKPCVLTPAAGGFNLGPLGKIGGIKWASYLFLIDCLLMMFTVFGMTMSLVYRYTNIFPGIVKKIGTSRWMIAVSLTIQAFIAILFCLVVEKFLMFDHNAMVIMAMDFNPVLSRFTNELTFMLVDKEFVFPIVIAVWIIMVIVSILFIIVAVALIFELTHNQYTAHNSDLQKALILSCIVQIGLTLIFLFIPVMVFFYYVTFGYVYGGPITMIAFSVLSLHAIMEMLATTYFVLPYRNFVLRKLFNIHMEKNNAIIPSFANTSNKY